MKKSLLLFALLLWVGVQAVYAQTKARGRVLDGESGNEPIPGASIRVVSTGAGTVTDLDGNFEIDIPENSNGMVEISSAGLAAQTVKASENMSVVLKSGQNVLVDVVVTSPYGPPVSKEKYVGAADVVTAKKIENTPVSDISKAIEGAAPGVQVTNGSGQPGSGASIQVRGRGSLSASTSPLIVVDGAPYDGDLTSINPMDVAAMNILKDAMATSLYGARGSNGVILITTKRGKAGEKARITVDGKMGYVTRGLPNYNVMTDPKDYYEMSWRGQYNSLITRGFSPQQAGTNASGISSIADAVVYQLGYNSYKLSGVGDSLQDTYLLDPVTGKLNPNATLRYKDDWQKAMQRRALRQEYNFNISGASDKTDYYLSAGYLKEQGYIINTDYSRFTTRLNVNTQATDWLKAGLNVSGSMGIQNGTGSGTSANSGNPTFVTLSMAPIYPVYWRDENDNTVIDPATGKNKLDYGNPTGDPDFSMGQRANLPGNNPVGQLLSDQNKTDVKNVVIVPYIEAKLMKGLSFLTRFNASYTNYIGQSYSNRSHGIQIGQGSLQKYSQSDFSYTWNQMLTYQKTFNEKHDFTLTAGHENYYLNTSYFLGYITGFASDAFREFSVGTGVPTLSSKTDNDRIESYFAVANYTYNGKYIFQANVRRDGLSRFHPDSRWGNFGGIGGAWLLNEEGFMKDVSWVNSLKVKASYGTNGNSGIQFDNGSQNYYAYQSLYDISRPNGPNTAAIPVSLSSNELQWETQKAFNVGAEFSLFNQRVSGEVNFFNRQTADLYFNVPNPLSSGIDKQILNTASMYNRGIELNFYVTPVKTKNFSWTFNTNWTTYKNQITKLANSVDSVIKGNTILKPGYDFSTFYLTHSSGVNPANGDELYSYYDSASQSTRDTFNYSDVAVNYRFAAGNATPKFSGAITNTFSYKGLELSFLITYSVGGKYYDATYQSIMGNTLTKIGGTNYSEDLMNSWTPENPTSSLPRFEFDNKHISGASDRFLIDASYINIRNVNLRYTLPVNLVKKTGLSSLSAYVSGDNIAFFSKRKGMNPQGSFTGEVAYPYNPARTIMFGLTLGL